MNTSQDLALFVFIDALGWEVFSRYGLLDEYWELAAPQQTILGYSCTCDPTILTGCLPSEHGHFSLFQRAKEPSPMRHLSWLQLLPSSLVNRGRVRHWLSRAVAKWYRYDGYFQLYETPFEYLRYFDYSEKRDIYQPGGINGGQPTIFDVLRSQQVQFSLSDWRRSESENLNRLRQDICSSQPGFAYLYLAALDGILHQFGTDSDRVAAHLEFYDKQLRNIIKLARCTYRDVRLYVFSDHGMTNVHQHFDLMSELQKLPIQFGRDYIAYLDSTMARFWFRNQAAAQMVSSQLNRSDHGRILTDSDLQNEGVLFSDRRYGELIFLCNPGVLICPSFMGGRPMAGMHGYEPEHPDSAALIAATNASGPMPQRLDQMFDLMRWEVERLASPDIALSQGVVSG